MINYKQFLINRFVELQQHTPIETRLEFLSSEIFGFVTYDSGMDELFARKAIEVCQAISERKTYEYLESEEGNAWYLLMCNMPFFANRIEWGVSIRGASWMSKLPNLGDFDFTPEEWEAFIRAVVDFAKQEPPHA